MGFESEEIALEQREDLDEAPLSDLAPEPGTGASRAVSQSTGAARPALAQGAIGQSRRAAAAHPSADRRRRVCDRAQDDPGGEASTGSSARRRQDDAETLVSECRAGAARPTGPGCR